MKTKKPNKQPEPRGRRQPPPQAGGWSGPRGLPDDVSRGPRLLAVGTFPGRGSGARTSPSRVTELSGERWPVLTLEARPPRRCSEARGEPAQPSPARVIGSNVAAGNKAGHTARRRAGCAGDRDGARGTSRGERAARLRRWQGTSPGWLLASELQSRLRKSHSGCRQMTGAIAGRVGCGDAGELAPFLTSN